LGNQKEKGSSEPRKRKERSIKKKKKRREEKKKETSARDSMLGQPELFGYVLIPKRTATRIRRRTIWKREGRKKLGRGGENRPHLRIIFGERTRPFGLGLLKGKKK